MKQIIIYLLLCLSLNRLFILPAQAVEKQVAESQVDQSTVVLAAPALIDDENKGALVLEYLVEFAKTVDEYQDVVVLASGQTLAKLEQHLSPHMLIDFSMTSVSLADIAPVGNQPPWLFRSPVAGDLTSYPRRSEAQQQLRHYTRQLGFRMQLVDLKLSAAQWQGNGSGIGLISEDVLKENHLDEKQARSIFSKLLQVEQLVFIPSLAGERLDAKLSWLSPEMLMINAYKEPFRSQLLSQLKPLVERIQILEVGELISEQSESMCGRYSGALLTDQALYLPLFNEQGSKLVSALAAYVDKPVVPVASEAVCALGISPGRLAWVVDGVHAQLLQQQTLEAKQQAAEQALQASEQEAQVIETQQQPSQQESQPIDTQQ